ncbi:MAG: hypothetical protein ACLPSW_05285 [Roseiarcus sp.]
MPEALFRAPFYTVWQLTIQKAVADVNNLDRKLFSDPALGGHLQAITQKYSLDVARLQKDRTEGRARQQEGRVRDAWGDDRTMTRGWLDITIPFTGDAESFRICPSRSIIPSHGAEIGHQQLVLTLPDDDAAEGAVQTFISQANQNLDVLRSEYEQAKSQLEQAVQQAAERRKAQIAAEGERDKKLSFPVRR